jgi:hypothetical protein
MGIGCLSGCPHAYPAAKTYLVVVAEGKRRQIAVCLWMAFAAVWLVTRWVLIRRRAMASAAP